MQFLKNKMGSNTLSLTAFTEHLNYQLAWTLLFAVLLTGISCAKALATEQILVFSAHTGNALAQSSAATAVKSRLSRSGFMVRDELSLWTTSASRQKATRTEFCNKPMT